MVRHAKGQQGRDLWLVPDNGVPMEFLRLYSEVVENEVKRFLAEEGTSASLPFSGPYITETFEQAKELILGGKKLRGSLVALGFSIAGGEKELRDVALRSSIGYEFLHNAFLVHDDIMDRATIRRLKEVSWRKFAAMSSTHSEHFGISQAINLGDMIAFWGPRLIADERFPGKRVSRAISILSYAVQTTVIGQTLDIVPCESLSRLSEEHVLTIAQKKTAFYSFVAPLQIGLTLGGAKPGSKFLAIESFGIPVGIAFQLQDDILGVYGQEEELGKSTVSDLAEGKKTLFFVELYQRLPPEDRKQLDALWGRANVGSMELEWVRQKGREVGALVAVQEYAEMLVANSLKVIPRISRESRVQRLLENLARFVIMRRY